VSRVLVTDAKGILECFDFSMEKMAFAFGVTLGELVGKTTRLVGIHLQGQPLLQQIHWSLECYKAFW